MKEAGKKSRVIEVYSLIFIDLLCTGVWTVSFFTSGI